jgi:hypothetical protein
MLNQNDKDASDEHVIPENIYFFDDRFTGVTLNHGQKRALTGLCVLTIVLGLLFIFKFVI